MSCFFLNILFYIYYIGFFFFEVVGKNDYKYYKKYYYKYDKNKKNYYKLKNGIVFDNLNKVK